MEYNTKSIISHIPAIAYEGEVTIKLYNDNKLVKTFANHNNGTNRLFSFILSCKEELVSAKAKKFAEKITVTVNVTIFKILLITIPP